MKLIKYDLVTKKVIGVSEIPDRWIDSLGNDWLENLANKGMGITLLYDDSINLNNYSYIDGELVNSGT